MDLGSVLSGDKPLQFEVSLDIPSVSYLAGALLLVGVLLIIIGKKIVK